MAKLAVDEQAWCSFSPLSEDIFLRKAPLNPAFGFSGTFTLYFIIFRMIRFSFVILFIFFGLVYFVSGTTLSPSLVNLAHFWPNVHG